MIGSVDIRINAVTEFDRTRTNIERLNAILFLVKTYGLTAQAYDNMLVAQNGVCAICLEKEAHRRLSVDHDHITGKVRSLLCSKCNSALGLMKESPDKIERLKQYVLAHREK